MPENLDRLFLRRLKDHSWSLGRGGHNDSLGEAARKSLTPEGYINKAVERGLKETGGEPMTRLKADTPAKRRTANYVRMRHIIHSDRRLGTRKVK